MTIATRRITDNHIGIIGVLAWAAIVTTTLASQLAAGAKAFPFILTPLAHAVAAACGLRASMPSLELKFAVYMTTFIVLAAIFAWACWRCSAHPVQRDTGAGTVTALILAQMLIALAGETQLLLIVAVELAFVLPRTTAVYWLLGQMTAFAALQVPALFGIDRMAPLDPLGAAFERFMALVWMTMAFGIGYLAAFERRGRIKLALAHAELLGTRQLLDDTLRGAERARISRNLHDAIGHHLTALNLHLDLGLRQTGDDAQASLRIARELAQRLLAEVRDVVSVERGRGPIDLRQSLAALCSGIPYPAIALRYELAGAIDDPALAHALYRVVQECITNTIRHSDASTLAVTIASGGGGIVASILDNGKGAVAIREGDGLQGMRRRIDELAGTLDIKAVPKSGLGVHVWLPAGAAP